MLQHAPETERAGMRAIRVSEEVYKRGCRQRHMLPDEGLLEWRCRLSAQPSPFLVLLKLTVHLLQPDEMLAWSTIRLALLPLMHQYALQLLFLSQVFVV